MENEERVDAPNQKLEDLWSIPLPLDRGELRVLEWNRYLRKYRRCLKLVEDWNEASEIRHLLKDVLPGNWKRRVEEEEKKRAQKRAAVRIMAAEDTHAGIMEFFRRNLGEPNQMLGLKNAVYVEVFGDSMGQRLLRLNNVEWRHGEPLRMQVIFARMSLDEIVKYITVELKLNAKNEAHVQDRHGHGQRGHREDCHHREIQEDTATVSARCMRRTRRPTSPPTPRRSPRSSGLPTGRRRAETGEKAKAKAKGKAEEEAMVVDLAKTDE